MTPRELAFDLMEAVLDGNIQVGKFCSEFEILLNFNWPELNLESDLAIFEALFEVVAYYTPFPEEKETVYVGYQTAPEVLAAVGKSLAALKAQPSNQPGRAGARRLF